MKDIMDIFKDSEGHSLEINSWYRIPPNTSNFYRFKEYEKGRAVFEVFGFDGYTTTYSFMEEQIAMADKIDINDFLEGKRKQISAIEKALTQTSFKCTEKELSTTGIEDINQLDPYNKCPRGQSLSD